MSLLNRVRNALVDGAHSSGPVRSQTRAWRFELSIQETWLWRRLDRATGREVAHSAESFPTLQICIRDAERHEYDADDPAVFDFRAHAPDPDGMTALAPFVERRSSARLKETPLRRRKLCMTAAPERRRKRSKGIDVAGELERQLDAYSTRPAMLTYLRSLSYAAEGSGVGARHAAYRRALERALPVVRNAEDTRVAVATLHGYQNFMSMHDVDSGLR